MNGIDIGITAAYLLSVLMLGIYLTWRTKKLKKPGVQSMEDYYLAERKLSWWALSLADLSSYVDISGTMINTALVYALARTQIVPGLSGMFIELRGGVCVALVFQLAFTGKLARRCQVMTKAELFLLRFGSGRQGVAARAVTALASIMATVIMVAYFAEGGGKFVMEFVDIPDYMGLPGSFWGAGLLMLISLSYTLINGFFSIVIVDVYQSIFMFSAFIYVAILAALVTLPAEFDVFIPNTNSTTSFIAFPTTFSDWTNVVPQQEKSFPDNSTYSIYNLFAVAIGVYIVQQSVESLGGPSSGGLQTVLAQRDDRSVAKQTLLAVVLLSLRWGFSAGLAVLAVQYTVNNPNIAIDPEAVLPIVLQNSLPTGGRGFVVAALLAAAMTTFDSTINRSIALLKRDTVVCSGSSYWAVDLYAGILRPKATPAQTLWHARASTLAIMLLGWFLVLMVSSINEIWGFVTMAFGGATAWPSLFAWYWSRYNGYGYCIGTLAGIASACVLFFAFPNWTEYNSFAFSSAFSISFSLIATFATEATPPDVLEEFYRRTKTPGLWQSVALRCFSRDDRSRIFLDNAWDAASVVIAMPAQLSLYFLSMSLVTGCWVQAAVIFGIFSALSVTLYFTWYRRLAASAALEEEHDMDRTPLLHSKDNIND